MTSAATADAAAEVRRLGLLAWQCRRARRLHLVNRLSLTTLQPTGMGYFGLMGSTSTLATTLTLSAVVNAIGIGFQQGTHASWQIVHNSGSGSPTLIDLGGDFSVISATNVLMLFLYAAPNAGAVWVRVVEEVSGAIAEVELTPNLPAASQLLISAPATT